jgi:excisionase family DNA binding protein
MNKSEAAEYLGISARSLERYTAQGRLSHTLKKGKTRPVLDYDESELERLKAELQAALDAPARPSSPNSDTPSNALAVLAKNPSGLAAKARLTSPVGIGELGGFSREQLQVLAGLAGALSGRQGRELGPALLLTLDDCAALTGLSRAHLRAAVASGELASKKIGRSFRVRREELERWVRETC